MALFSYAKSQIKVLLLNFFSNWRPAAKKIFSVFLNRLLLFFQPCTKCISYLQAIGNSEKKQFLKKIIFYVGTHGKLQAYSVAAMLSLWATVYHFVLFWIGFCQAQHYPWTLVKLDLMNCMHHFSECNYFSFLNMHCLYSLYALPLTPICIASNLYMICL